MIPRISKSYLAMSGGGFVTASFDNPLRLRAFIANQAKRGVRLEAVEQTITLKPLPAQAIDARSDETPAQPDRAKARSEGCALAKVGGSA